MVFAANFGLHTSWGESFKDCMLVCGCTCRCVVVQLSSSFILTDKDKCDGEKFVQRNEKWKHLAGTEACSGRSLFVQLLAASIVDARAAMLIISASLVSGKRTVSSRSVLAMREA